MIASPSDVQTGIELIVRIPGPWSTPEVFRDALCSAIQVVDGELLTPDGASYELFVRPMDQDLPKFFAKSRRIQPSSQQLQEIRDAPVIIGVVGPGGSLESARRFLQVTAELIQAGGYGVFLDNSGRVHLASDWSELADNTDDMDALVYAYVSLIHGPEKLYSLGMHTLGCRDLALITDQAQSETQFFSSLLAQVAARSMDLPANGVVELPRKGCYRITTCTSDRVPEGSPLFNPFGSWELSKIG